MNQIEYKSLQSLKESELLNILNKEEVREHLVLHDEFDMATLRKWVAGKLAVDASKGCKVKGIMVNGSVAGWCGIQFENGAYELAIVLDKKYWGLGVRVFKEVMSWALALGHDYVVLHLFHTRPEYQFLKRMASRVYESRMFGQSYTSYELSVPPAQ